MSEGVHCETHGLSEATFVCSHVAESLKDGQPRGFWWTKDEDGEYMASCDECQQLSQNEWDQAAEEVIRLLCFGCYLRAAELNGVEIPGVH